MHKYLCHVCIHTHKTPINPHLTAVLHHSPHTYFGTCPTSSSSFILPFIRGTDTIPHSPFLFSHLGVTGTITGPSIPLSFAISGPTCRWEDSVTIMTSFYMCVCSNKVSEGCKSLAILVSQCTVDLPRTTINPFSY